MDGNGRWATGRGLPRAAGHQQGAEALRRIVEAAPACGVDILTVYAFSSDNWKRPPLEVETLMALLGWYLEHETPRCLANGVRMTIIGRRDRLPDSLVALIDAAEQTTRACSRLHLRIAIDYSARDAILSASQRAAGEQLTRERFEELLGETRPVDVLIRTGGEQRLSDFLLWECAYAELVFTESDVAGFPALRIWRARSASSRIASGALARVPQAARRWFTITGCVEGLRKS